MFKSKRTYATIIGILVVALVGILVFNRAQKNNLQTSETVNKTNVQKKSSASKKRTLVVFFSRAGQNYPNVSLKTGYTQQIADIISQRTTATQYVITPAKVYPYSYQATVKRATREQRENARPKIKISYLILKITIQFLLVILFGMCICQ